MGTIKKALIWCGSVVAVCLRWINKERVTILLVLLLISFSSQAYIKPLLEVRDQSWSPCKVADIKGYIFVHSVKIFNDHECLKSDQERADATKIELATIDAKATLERRNAELRSGLIEIIAIRYMETATSGELKSLLDEIKR